MSHDATALLVVDVQNFYFAGGRLELEGPLEACAKARVAIDAFRARAWPVVHVQHLPAEQAGPSPDSGPEAIRIHSQVQPVTGEAVIGKHHANAFRDTGLVELLRGLGVRRLAVCGMQTHMCVEAVTRAAVDLGFEVTVLHDACATRALAFGDVVVPAAHVHAAALAAMASMYARVVAVDAYLAELP